MLQCLKVNYNKKSVIRFFKYMFKFQNFITSEFEINYYFQGKCKQVMGYLLIAKVIKFIKHVLTLCIPFGSNIYKFLKGWYWNLGTLITKFWKKKMFKE
jgi:hypothetical protein